MLIITMELTAERSQYIWHFGEPFPDINPEKVLTLYADGDELLFLLNHYPIGNPKVNVFQVSGSDAKYMVEGIKAFVAKRIQS